MNVIRGLVQGVRGWLNKPVGSSETDPQSFLGKLYGMPNPDPILRQIGRAELVYASIMADAHVMGELRSIRGSFRSHEYRIVAGEEGDGKSAAARDLCEQWMRSAPPNKLSDWLEVMWQMSASIFTGYRAHEVVWGMADGKFLPVEVIDRPNRRFLFNPESDPLLISRGNLMGAPVEPYQFVISRNMPTYDNPYGVALFSSCYYPWLYKTGGWRYLVKYCERHGLPWPVARYPQGASDEDINKLDQALAEMIESAYLVTQDGNGVELLSPKGGGSDLPQERLIVLANREMSKAITSQAMVGEAMEVGSRAAAETAKERQDEVHDSDRDIAAAGMSHIFKWITLFNFGDDVAPPKLEFYKRQVAGKARAETYKMVADMGARPSKSAMLEELDIPVAEDDDDALLPSRKGAAPNLGAELPEDVDFSALPGFEFAKAAGITEDEAVQLAADAADQTIEDKMIAPIYRMLVEYEQDGKTLKQFRDALAGLVGEMDDDGLREVLERALAYSYLAGVATRAA
ncbi:DUF935 domain-containing protein [Variovorax boronicumulans]